MTLSEKTRIISIVDNVSRLRSSYRRGRESFYREYTRLAIPLRKYSVMTDSLADRLYLSTQRGLLKISGGLPGEAPSVDFKPALPEGVANSQDCALFRNLNLLFLSAAGVLVGGSLYPEVFTQVVDQYKNQLESSPYLWNAVTTSVRLSLGDLLAQKIQGQPWNVRRSLVTLGLGLGYGDLFYLEYKALEYVPISPYLGWSLGRSIIDNLLVVPLFVAFHFCAVGKLIYGHSKKRIWADQFKKEYKPTITAGLKLWVPAECVIQLFVPLKFRVLVMNVVAFLWNIYLSRKSNPKGKV